MGIITDQIVLNAVKECGTATAPMIYDFIQGEMPDVLRETISSRAGKKLKQLVKYRMICSMTFEKRVWYYMPDTIPDPMHGTPKCGAERIRDSVNNLPEGGSITVQKATEIGRCSKSQARRTLSSMKCLRRDVSMNAYFKECI